MAEARRDENRITSILAVSDVDGVTPVLVAVDSATGRLLAEITPVTDSSPAALPVNAPRDANNMPTGLIVTDDSNLTVTPFLIDNRNGYLYADVLVE